MVASTKHGRRRLRVPVESSMSVLGPMLPRTPLTKHVVICSGIRQGAPTVLFDNNCLKLLAILLLTSSGLFAQTPMHVEVGQIPRNVSFCDLANDPLAFNHELTRITAFVAHGFEDFTLFAPGCPEVASHFAVWVTYGGKMQSSTVYCC